ncbi:MAG: DEAD/DEAH box helicase [Candidatus Hydrogenedentes bacterium]|nr:DEAD/DEAH box helicase [Candidatus Hydrogenedentota bacterium]
MKMQELAGYGIPTALSTQWQEQQGPGLLPLQEQAIRKYDLFGTDNLLVQAPTSSGKTFIGEMAAAHTVLQGRRVVFLVPLKALAEEKYQDFQKKYAAYGMRVIVCTRDHRNFDLAFKGGDFDIAVAVYEKFERLIVSYPERLHEIALVVADELEILSDPERGVTIELLLTRLLIIGTRLIGLSAVLGEAEQLASWLKARLLEQDRRPRELRYGVLHEGQYRYCGHNDHSEGKEELEMSHGETTWSEVMTNVRLLAEQGEPCLIFVKARREAWRGAEALSRRVSLAAASTCIDALRALPPTRSRNLLLRICETGTAFHSADLLPEERRIVETAFRSGEIKILVATYTLAAGMNLPVRNVFVSTDKWIYDPDLDLPWRSPITQGEFENMSGRAGRYGSGSEYGRAILVAASPLERDALWQRYVKGQRDAIAPRIAQSTLDDSIVQLVASRYCKSMGDLEAFFNQSLSAQPTPTNRFIGEEIHFRLSAALRRCIEIGAVQACDADAALFSITPGSALEGLSLSASPFGRTIAAKGLSLASARMLRHWLRLSENREWYPLDFLLSLAMLPDARLRQVTLTRREYESGVYVKQMKEQSAARELHTDIPINRFRNCRLMPYYDEVRAIKTALFLECWMEETSMEDIENTYDVSAGQIRTAADTLAWLADGAAALADAQNLAPSFAEALRRFSERINLGIGNALLEVARVLPTLPRSALFALDKAELIHPNRLKQVESTVLEQWLSPSQAAALKAWAAAQDASEQEDTPAQHNTPILIIDERRPDSICIKDSKIALQKKQYQLILALAEHPGECVAYEDIYHQIWGDIIVEDNQLHYQKRILTQRLAEVDPSFAAYIGTIPKHGFVLKLKAAQVSIIKKKSHAA